MRSVSFLGKFTSGSRISASRSELLKLPIVVVAAVIAAMVEERFIFSPTWISFWYK